MICAWEKCGREFEPSKGGKNHSSRISRQKFCQSKCQRAAFYAANPGRYKSYTRRKEDPRHSRDRTLRYKYGIGCEDYDQMLAAQGGRCAICGGTDTKCSVGDFFAVDHDHATGAVRALLCGSCNKALGLMRESPARLRAAADYLERYGLKAAG